jgi:hypothetical protein
LLKNFGDHVEKVTERLKEASLAEAKACRRPVPYLHSSQIDKETIARNILLRAHARITKISDTHRYQLTPTGRKTIVAILSALRSTLAQFTPVTAQLTALAA